MPLKANETNCEVDHCQGEKVIGEDGSPVGDNDVSE
jgi:hypothetical protein